MKKLLTTAILCSFVLFTACSEQKSEAKDNKPISENHKSIAENSVNNAKNETNIIKADPICDLDFIKSEVKYTNENLQIFTDEVQTFNGVKCQNSTMIFDYAYTPKYSAQLEKASNEQKLNANMLMQNTLKNMYCNMPEFEQYRKHNVTFIYNYSTINKPIFYEIKISNSDCQN